MAGVKSGTIIGFADEMRVGLLGMVRRVWGVRGRKVIQKIQLEYKWKYLFLVVDFMRGKLEWTWMDSMKSAELFRAIAGIKRDTEVRALVWDGARSHRSELVRMIEEVKTVVQPPYSPELNPAERVFEEVRRRVEGRVYESVEEKMKAVNECLSYLEADPERVKSLASWDWIGQNVQSLNEDYMAISHWNSITFHSYLQESGYRHVFRYLQETWTPISGLKKSRNRRPRQSRRKCKPGYRATTGPSTGWEPSRPVHSAERHDMTQCSSSACPRRSARV